MVDPLTPTEIESLSRGVQGSPWHQVDVAIFDRPRTDETFDLAQLEARVLDRLPFAPRFRQRVRETVAGLDWIDDPAFDVKRHLKSYTLEAPGTLAQVTDLVAGGLTQPFEAGHPQWDMLLVDGLRGGQIAIVSRAHPAYVDGVAHVHLVHELLDEEPQPVVPTPQPWTPAPAGNPGDDLVSGVVSGVQDPLAALGRLGARVGRGVGQGLSFLQQQRIPGLARNEPVQPTTRYAGGTLVSLAAINRVRDNLGCTTHDVIVDLVTAGLRQWQTQLGAESADVVALIPLAVREKRGGGSSVACDVAPQYVTLPVRTASPQGRIDQIASLTRSRIDSGLTVGGDDLTRLAGFAPATLHAMGARTVTGGRAHDVYIGNAPGPRVPRFLGAWELHSSYPLIGLADSQDVTVSVTSYQGRVGFGVVASSPVQALVDGIAAELSRLDGGRR